MESGSRSTQGETSEQKPLLDPAEEELYAGTKIDSEAEALASAQAVEEALTVGGALPPEDTDVQGMAYTLGMWRVQPGQKAAFIAAWHELAALFRQLPQPPGGQGVLIQSITEPDLFYSFGPWQSMADIEAMRQDAGVQAAIGGLRSMCSAAGAGSYRIIATEEGAEGAAKDAG